MEKEGIARVKMFMAITVAYLVFWGPLFLVTLFSYSDYKTEKPSTSHEVSNPRANTQFRQDLFAKITLCRSLSTSLSSTRLSIPLCSSSYTKAWGRPLWTCCVATSAAATTATPVTTTSCRPPPCMWPRPRPGRSRKSWASSRASERPTTKMKASTTTTSTWRRNYRPTPRPTGANSSSSNNNNSRSSAGIRPLRDSSGSPTEFRLPSRPSTEPTCEWWEHEYI